MVDSALHITYGGELDVGADWSRDFQHEVDHKFYWIFEGKARYEIEGFSPGVRMLEPGRLYFLAGHRPHRHSTKGMRFGFVHFRGRSLELEQALGAVDRIIGWPMEDGVVQRELGKINELFDQRHSPLYAGLDALGLEGALLLYVAELVRRYARRRAPEPSLVAQLRPAIEFMDDNFSRVPSLAEVAEQVRLHPVHFHRQFTKAYRLTPHDYMLRQRMRMARELLLSTGLQIKEIAYRCGYSDPAYFSRAIRKFFSTSPNALRVEGQRRLAG